MIYFLIVCLIIIGFLWYKLSQKQEIDRTALDNYKNEISETTRELQKLLNEVADLRHQARSAELDLASAKEKTEYEQYKLDECKKDLQAALDTY